MRKSIKSAISLSAAAILAAGLLAGCGSSDEAAESPNAPASSAAAEAPAAPKPGPVDPQEFADQTKKAMEDVNTMVMSGPMPIPSMGDVNVNVEVDATDRANMKMHLVADGLIEMIMVDNTSYTRPLTGDPEGPWVSTTVDMDTAQYTDAIEGFQGFASVEYIGPETINGVQTNHYELTDQSGTVSQVYLDDKDRAVRTTTNATGSELTFDFSDFNKPLDIVAPDPSQVTPA